MLRFLSYPSGWLILPVHNSKKWGGAIAFPAPCSTALVGVFKGRGKWEFSYCFFGTMFSLGGAETQDSILKIFRMH